MAIQVEKSMRVAISCSGCGLVYHVLPSKKEQKCFNCKEVTEIVAE